MQELHAGHQHRTLPCRSFSVHKLCSNVNGNIVSPEGLLTTYLSLAILGVKLALEARARHARLDYTHRSRE